MEVYACFNKDEDIRKQSSSGGIFALIAKKILDDNGIVYAVCYDEKFETRHEKIESNEALVSSLGSKYIPSKLNDTFENIRKNLSIDKKILFVGTPCQCMGLKRFLGKNYENLVMIDFICHGVPSKIAWRKYLEEISGTELRFINMRDKTLGWSEWKYNWLLEYKNGNRKIIPQENISFMKGFVKNFYLRPSCYQCCFKGIKRTTDITIGDCWGIWKEKPEIDDNKGTSVVIINSEKGKIIFEKIKNNILLYEADVNKVIKYNPSIIESAKISKSRELFFKKIKTKKSFENIIKFLIKYEEKNNIKNRIKKFLLK